MILFHRAPWKQNLIRSTNSTPEIYRDLKATHSWVVFYCCIPQNCKSRMAQLQDTKFNSGFWYHRLPIQHSTTLRGMVYPQLRRALVFFYVQQYNSKPAYSIRPTSKAANSQDERVFDGGFICLATNRDFMLTRQEESCPSASQPGAPEKTVSLSPRVSTSNFGIACHWLRGLTLDCYWRRDLTASRRCRHRRKAGTFSQHAV